MSFWVCQPQQNCMTTITEPGIKFSGLIDPWSIEPRAGWVQHAYVKDYESGHNIPYSYDDYLGTHTQLDPNVTITAKTMGDTFIVYRLNEDGSRDTSRSCWMQMGTPKYFGEKGHRLKMLNYPSYCTVSPTYWGNYTFAFYFHDTHQTHNLCHGDGC